MQVAGASPDESFIRLRNRYKSVSRPGGGTSHALTHTIHRLQTLASDYAPELTWKRRNIPPDLISFLMTTLEAAGIRHPDFAVNPSKFRQLMIKPCRKQKQSLEPNAQRLSETELERQLSKMPL